MTNDQLNEIIDEEISLYLDEKRKKKKKKKKKSGGKKMLAIIRLSLVMLSGHLHMHLVR